MSSLRNFVQDESGQDLVEYALLAALLAIVSVTALRSLGTKISGFYTTVGTSL